MARIKKFKLEEESIKSKELEENLCQDKRRSFRAWKYRSILYRHERNHTVRLHLPNWQNVSQCFSVVSSVDI